MVALGWSPPGVVAGSGDQFGLRTPVTDADRLAAAVSRTLRDVYGAPHPAFLVYLVHDADDEPIAVEPLGTARPESVSEERSRARPRRGDRGRPRRRSVAEVASARRAGAYGRRHDARRPTPEQLQVDSDGDIGIRAGSAMVFVRVRDNPPLVDVFSPVLTEVEPTEQLYVKLCELTNRMPIGRLYCTNDTVWASIPVFGRNFQATHLMLAVQVMTGLADELDDRLHGEFGGKRFFGEGDKPSKRRARRAPHRHVPLVDRIQARLVIVAGLVARSPASDTVHSVRSTISERRMELSPRQVDLAGLRMLHETHLGERVAGHPQHQRTAVGWNRWAHTLTSGTTSNRSAAQ